MSGPSVNFLESYVIGRNETRLSSLAWTSVLHLLPAADRKVARDLLERFVKLAQDGSLPHGLQSAKLDHMVREDMNQKVLSHAAAAIPASEISLLSSVLYQQSGL